MTANNIIAFGPASEIRRFRRNFEKNGAVNLDSIMPNPPVLLDLPPNHTQNKYYGLKEWHRNARACIVASSLILDASDERVEYHIITEHGDFVKFIYFASKYFEALEFDVSVEESDADTSRFFIKSGQVMPMGDL